MLPLRGKYPVTYEVMVPLANNRGRQKGMGSPMVLEYSDYRHGLPASEGPYKLKVGKMSGYDDRVIWFMTYEP